MSVTAFQAKQRNPDPYKLGRRPWHGGHGKHGGGGDGDGNATGHGTGGPASKYIIVGYGFWIFLLSDIIMFSAFFAAFAVLGGAYADGPTGRDLFDLQRVAVETGVLLMSSFVCGLSAVASAQRRVVLTEIALLVTGLLGAVFLYLEITEFLGMIAQNAGPQRSAFLSAFFAVVGLHGLHVFSGLLWLGTMMAQIVVKGFRPTIDRRLLCFNLFWHALDIIWVALFSVVYLMGAGR